MKKLRSINTKFWDDVWVTDLTPTEKLIWLYLLTNPLTNLIGVYEISIKKIAFDTGCESFETVRKALERFENDKKAYYLNDHIVLVNFFDNQSFNSNMVIGAKNEFNELPNVLKTYILGNPLKGFETLRKGLGILPKVELEYEYELEDNTTTTTTTTNGEIAEEAEVDFDYEIQEYFKANVPEGVDPIKEANIFIKMNDVKNWGAAGGKKNWGAVADLFIRKIKINNHKTENHGNGTKLGKTQSVADLLNRARELKDSGFKKYN
ncbi:hypothetical protein LLG07_04900 [bacterium]|nr:hypothetical protein [bacterium]